ncbi:nucleotidyltransferase domain-containing protein [Rubrivirga sp.]|uniref:nucleotidyltransferase domain-containing protein n=1 Tax=Rubrivirga sp. TaxID=1885344 RepID=UPI003B52711D
METTGLPYTADPLVRAVVEQVVAEADPLRVVLFGSRATGTARPDSDVDLSVVMPDGTDRRAARTRIGSRLRRPGVGIDLLVTTPAVLAASGDDPGPIYRTVLRTGREIYATARA